MASLAEEYQYHVFLSYRHLSKVEDWVRDFFLDELTTWLREELNGEEPLIFWDRDEIHTGTKWVQKIGEALLTSRCLVPVWAPSYFQSIWCLAEMESFLKREQVVSGLGVNSLVVPVKWHKNIPPQAPKTQPMDFTRFTWTGNGFKESSVYVGFQQRVQDFASDLALVVKQAPPFDRDWPVYTPDQIESTQGAPTREPIPRMVFQRKIA